jgi:cold shock CspA family protein
MSVATKRTGRVVRVGCGAFGFIRPDDGTPDLFFHTRQVEGSEPEQGERVSFKRGRDGHGRPRADDVKVIG